MSYCCLLEDFWSSCPPELYNPDSMRGRALSRAEKWGAASVILAAFAIGASFFVPEVRKTLGLEKSVPAGAKTIAGIVVDENSHQGVGQATVTIDGRTEGYVTEDSGNFRIDIRGDAPKRLRLHVSKSGFRPFDTSVEPPVENLVLQLDKQ
jgi:hypothetical protein